MSTVQNKKPYFFSEMMAEIEVIMKKHSSFEPYDSNVSGSENRQFGRFETQEGKDACIRELTRYCDRNAYGKDVIDVWDDDKHYGNEDAAEAKKITERYPFGVHIKFFDLR